MTFDPTINYGDTDLSINENVIRWKFGELVKLLVTLSIDSNKQIEIMGYGCVTEEMADDFDTYFTLSFQIFLDNKLLNLEEVNCLQKLAVFFKTRSNEISSEFWDDTKLDINSDWQFVRQQAKEILTTLKMDDLKIEFKRDETNTTSDTGQSLIVQKTKTCLVRQNAS